MALRPFHEYQRTCRKPQTCCSPSLIHVPRSKQLLAALLLGRGHPQVTVENLWFLKNTTEKFKVKLLCNEVSFKNFHKLWHFSQTTPICFDGSSCSPFHSLSLCFFFAFFSITPSHPTLQFHSLSRARFNWTIALLLLLVTSCLSVSHSSSESLALTHSGARSIPSKSVEVSLSVLVYYFARNVSFLRVLVTFV